MSAMTEEGTAAPDFTLPIAGSLKAECVYAGALTASPRDRAVADIRAS